MRILRSWTEGNGCLTAPLNRRSRWSLPCASVLTTVFEIWNSLQKHLIDNLNPRTPTSCSPTLQRRTSSRITLAACAKIVSNAISSVKMVLNWLKHVSQEQPQIPDTRRFKRAASARDFCKFLLAGTFTVLQESSSVIVVAPFASTFCCFHWSQLHLAGNFTHQWTGNWLLGHLLFRSLGILGKRSHPVEQHSQTSSRRRASCSLMVLFLIWPNPLEHSLQTFGSASPCPTALIVLLSHSNQFSLPCLGICHRLEKNLPLRSHELESLASDESCLDPLLRKEWFYLQNWITSMRWMLIKWWWPEYCDSTIWRFNSVGNHLLCSS